MEKNKDLGLNKYRQFCTLANGARDIELCSNK